MFDERTHMNSDPTPNDLESLLAADEASIADDGFSSRVIREVNVAPAKASGARRFVIYGAGLTGLGFAVGSLPALVKALPPLQLAIDTAAKMPDFTRLASWTPDSQVTFLVAGAAVAMILTGALLVLRER
jgi:hypothetical protein